MSRWRGGEAAEHRDPAAASGPGQRTIDDPGLDGSEFVDAYVKLKQHEWAEHQTQISPWERQTTLDC